MAGKLSLSVVTPEGGLFEGEANFVAAPAVDGEVGILERHTALISALGTGLLRVEEEAGTRSFAVRGGFLQVLGNEVTLLVTEAVKPEDVDAAALAGEWKEILEALRRPESDERYAELLESRRWLEAREKLAAAS